jgi:hypothetical protein
MSSIEIRSGTVNADSSERSRPELISGVFGKVDHRRFSSGGKFPEVPTFEEQLETLGGSHLMRFRA